MTPEEKRKVFILGDSRTGTMTLHRFLSAAGWNSIHYYMQESGVTQPVHLEMEKNWVLVKKFIDNSGYEAFSDYPTRSFFVEIFDEYPDAYFILTTRKDVATWRESMVSFFSKFNIPIDIDALSEVYLKTNEHIRKQAALTGVRFIEICIDDSNNLNEMKLKEFFGIGVGVELGWENRSASYDAKMLSSRVSVYNTESKNVVDYVKSACAPGKVMVSEYGWLYLVNEESDFVDYAFGNRSWDSENLRKVRKVFDERIAWFEGEGLAYLKFVVPEKMTVYPEYLPKVFSGQRLSETRPAVMLERLEIPQVSYLRDALIDSKSLGRLYFRGDTHTNWLGSFVVYLNVIWRLNAVLGSGRARPPIGLSELKAEIIGYAGDLFVQMTDEQKAYFTGAWKDVMPGDFLEHCVRLYLPEFRRSATRLKTPKEYEEGLGDRECFVFSGGNKKLPRAVIFRDSTCDFIVDLLAEHFSRSVFVWYKGVVCKDIIGREEPDVVLHVMAERFVVTYPGSAPLTRCLKQ